MLAAGGTTSVISLGPVLTLVMAVGALLAFTERFRRAGTLMALCALLLLGAAFVV